MDGYNGLGPSMFDHLGVKVGPDPDEMKKALERVQFQRVVKFQSHHVKIFDMHDQKQVKEYEKLFRILSLGVQANTHKLWENERQVLPQKDGTQHWMRYLEWSEFELKESATAPVGATR